MKRLTIFMLIGVLLIGAVYGQGIRNEQRADNRQRNNDSQRSDERQRSADQQRSAGQQRNDPVTVEGTLKLERGFVAVESGETVYLVPMLNRYIGFISDLKEGARVSVEGRGFRNTIHPTKVTIGGKSYDFPSNNRAPNFGNRSNDRRPDNFGPGKKNFGADRRNAPRRGIRCH